MSLNLDPRTAQKVETFLRLCARDGIHPAIVSGGRTRAQQTALYTAFQTGRGGLAAPPGRSCHEYGAAIDVYLPGMRANKAWATMLQHAVSVGLTPLSEPYATQDPGHLQDLATCRMLRDREAPGRPLPTAPTAQQAVAVVVPQAPRRKGCA